jgi:hypothetical protein
MHGCSAKKAMPERFRLAHGKGENALECACNDYAHPAPWKNWEPPMDVGSINGIAAERRSRHGNRTVCPGIKIYV